MRATFKTLLAFLIILGLGMGVSFGAGTAYGRSNGAKAAEATKTAVGVSTDQQASRGNGTQGDASAQARTGGNFNAGAGAAMGGARPALTGVVETLGTDSLTISTGQGSPAKVAVGDKTTVQRNISGTIKDLKTGDRVMVMGQRGNDGTLAATSIQVVPQGQAP